MGALDGTINTPIGDLPKKQVLIVGGAAAIGTVLWYRNRQAKNAVANAGASTEINPATGYVYGSPEDAAALAAQSNYMTGAAAGGGGGPSGAGSSTGGVYTNAAWTNEVLSYWNDHDLGDNTLMAAALGVYLSGGIPTSDQTNLIHQATAIAGLPPVAGAGGFPPAINTASPSNPPPPPSGGGGGGSDNPPPSNSVDTYSFTVNPGKQVYKVSQWVRDVNAWIREAKRLKGITSWGGISYEEIAAQNPGLDKNINWVSDTEKTTFKSTQTYTVRA